MTKVNDIIDITKTYAREKFREWFYEFDTLVECEKYIKDGKKTPYAFYDGIHIYSQEEVNKVCMLRKNGRKNEIRY